MIKHATPDLPSSESMDVEICRLQEECRCLRAEIQRLVVDLIGFRDAAADEMIKLHVEIERLHGIESAAKTAADIYEARIEQLEAEAQQLDGHRKALAAESDHMRARIERLEAALTEITNLHYLYASEEVIAGNADRIARAVLARKEG